MEITTPKPGHAAVVINDVNGALHTMDVKVTHSTVTPNVIEGETFGDSTFFWAMEPDRIESYNFELKGRTSNFRIELSEEGRRRLEASRKATDLVNLLALQNGVQPDSALLQGLTDYFTHVASLPELVEPEPDDVDDLPENDGPLGRPATWEVR